MRRIPALAPLLLLTVWGTPVPDLYAADEDLVLEASVVPGRPQRGVLPVLRATFRNAGETAVRLYLPPFAGAAPFPTWEILAPDGVAYVPVAAPFQTAVGDGIQGRIVEIEPGAETAFDVSLARVSRRTEVTERGVFDPVPLPPGGYVASCRYERAHDRVPVRRGGVTRAEPQPGLWVGALESDRIDMVVEPSTAPHLTFEAPGTVALGAPCPVTLVLHNPSDQNVSVRGAFELGAGTKAWGTGRVRLVSRGDALVHQDAGVALVELGSGRARAWTVDLAAIPYERADGDDRVGLYDLAPQGGFRLFARFVPETGEAPILPAAAEVAVLPAAPAEGLAVLLETAGGPSGRPHVAVVLRNVGDRALRVPGDLGYPRHVYFSVRRGETDGAVHRITFPSGSMRRWMDPDEPGGEALVADGWAWDGAAFEPSRAPEAQTTVLLPPGGELRRTFDLAALLVRKELPRGVIHVRAFWRNRDPGTRLGLEEPLVTGVTASDPVEVRVRIW